MIALLMMSRWNVDIRDDSLSPVAIQVKRCEAGWMWWCVFTSVEHRPAVWSMFSHLVPGLFDVPDQFIMLCDGFPRLLRRPPRQPGRLGASKVVIVIISVHFLSLLVWKLSPYTSIRCGSKTDKLNIKHETNARHLLSQIKTTITARNRTYKIYTKRTDLDRLRTKRRR